MKREKSNKKMVFILLIVMIVSMIPTVAFAADNRVLLDDEIKPTSFDQEDYKDAIYFECSRSDVDAHPENYSVWHLATIPKAACEKVTDMQVQFKDGRGNTDLFYNWHYTNADLSRNAEGPDGWVIYTPIDYVIYTDPEESNNHIIIPDADPKFIVSGYEKGIGPSSDKGSITLTNQDTDGQLISGASFKLVGSDEKTVSEQSTGADGKIKWNDLSFGNYTLYEMNAAPGYDIDSLTIDNINIGPNGYGFAVNSEENLDIIAYSTKSVEKQGTLVLDMKDYETNTSISGAAFELFDSGGKSCGEQFTGPEGTVSWSSLAVGEKYTLYETDPAPGYEDGSLRIGNELIGTAGYYITISQDDEDGILNLMATNVKETSDGGQDIDDNGNGGGSDNGNGGSNTNGGSNANGGEHESGGKVLADTAAHQQKVLGEEAKTGDHTDVLLVMLLALAALVAFGAIIVKNTDPYKKS